MTKAGRKRRHQGRNAPRAADESTRVPVELALVRGLGPEILPLAQPIGDRTEPLPLELAQRLGEATVHLVDDHFDEGRRAVYHALFRLLGPDLDPPAGFPNLLEALRRQACGEPAPELDWVLASVATTCDQRSHELPAPAPIALTGTLAALVRVGDGEALRSLVAAWRPAVRSALVQPLGTVLCAPVLAAVAASDAEFARDVIERRDAPVLAANALLRALRSGAHALSMDEIDALFTAAYRRWAEWARGVGRGALLPSTFGDDRWDARQWRRDAEHMRDSAAITLLIRGEYGAAADAFAERAAAGDHEAILGQVCAALEILSPWELDVPAPGTARAELGARLAPHVDALKQVFSAQLDWSVTPGAQQSDLGVLRRAAALLALAHILAGDAKTAHVALMLVDGVVEPNTAPPLFAYLRALALDGSDLDVAAPDLDHEVAELPDMPAQSLGLLLAISLDDALVTSSPADPDEAAGLLARIGADPQRHSAVVAELAEPLAAAIERDDIEMERIFSLAVLDPSPLERELNRAIAAVAVAIEDELDRFGVVSSLFHDVEALRELVDEWADPDELDEWVEADGLGHFLPDDAMAVRFRDLRDRIEERFAALGLRRAGLAAVARRVAAEEAKVAAAELTEREQAEREQQARRREEAAAQRAAREAAIEAPEARARDATPEPVVDLADTDDALAGAWTTERLEDALGRLGVEPTLAGDLADRLAELEDPSLDERWCDALRGGGSARYALGETEADLEWVRVLQRLGRDDVARGVATGLFWRAVNGTAGSYTPGDLLRLTEELGAGADELTAMRAELDRSVEAKDLEGGGVGELPSPVTVLFVGGNETQEAYHAEIDRMVEERFGGRVRVEWFITGWSPRWRTEAERVERAYERAHAVVLMRFMRTGLGRRLRRTVDDAALPWVACTGHGRGALLGAIDDAVRVVDEQRRAVIGTPHATAGTDQQGVLRVRPRP